MIFVVHSFTYYCNIETSIIIEKWIMVSLFQKRAFSNEKALSVYNTLIVRDFNSPTVNTFSMHF